MLGDQLVLQCERRPQPGGVHEDRLGRRVQVWNLPARHPAAGQERQDLPIPVDPPGAVPLPRRGGQHLWVGWCLPRGRLLLPLQPRRRQERDPEPGGPGDLRADADRLDQLCCHRSTFQQ